MNKILQIYRQSFYVIGLYTCRQHGIKTTLDGMDVLHYLCPYQTATRRHPISTSSSNAEYTPHHVTANQIPPWARRYVNYAPSRRTAITSGP